ncbi:MAG: NBR1-Ig-like domain-containing protein [Bacteroidota bacterium]
MTIQPRRIIAPILAAVFLLAACSPAPVTPTDQVNIGDQVATSVAATVMALQSATAAAQPPATNTPVPEPATPTPVLPTATPFVVPTATSFSTHSGGGTTSLTYACDVIRQRPFDNTVFHPGDKFDIKWTILNTGTATWRAGTDLAYSSGPRLTRANIVEMPEMKPDDQFSVVFDAQAPQEPGRYVMVWKVQGGFCFPYVAITVERPPDP